LTYFNRGQQLVRAPPKESALLWASRRAGSIRFPLTMVKAHPYCFRATFCTTLFRKNVPMPDIMKVMGHKDVQSTMRYMAVLQKKDLHAKMAKVKFAVA
jgi:integrase